VPPSSPRRAALVRSVLVKRKAFFELPARRGEVA
jgi:hypothetical protein